MFPFSNPILIIIIIINSIYIVSISLAVLGALQKLIMY